MMLEVRGLCAFYGQSQALHDIGFAIDEGGIVTLLGANGAGKTTTLRALCGMVRISGEIAFDGKPIAGRATETIARLGIAHVPEGRGTFTRMTVEENLQLGAMTRRDRAAIAADIEEVYGEFPRLKERRRQQAGTLSGGEQQMLAVGRALMLRPRLLLLDEPSFGLAPLIVAELFGILRRLNQRRRVAMLIVEQNAALALDLAEEAYLLETGRIVMAGAAARNRQGRGGAPLVSGVLKAAMEQLLQQVLAGLATGAIYAAMALAVVMIYQAIDHLNFAQGEMATFSTFFAWQMIQWGWPYWAAFAITVAASFLGGVAIERILFRPIRNAPILSQLVAFIALFSILNSADGEIWDFNIKTFPTPFGTRPLFGSSLISTHQAGMIVVTFVMLALLYLFFRGSRLGLAMRAAAANPQSARLVGIRVGWMVALGWGMSAAIGAVAGMLIAPVVFLEPNMMLGVLLYGFAGAVLGGLSSPGGAVIGGFAVGVIENLAGTFIPYVGHELKLTIALVLIVAVLMVRPAGLFGRVTVSRV